MAGFLSPQNSQKYSKIEPYGLFIVIALMLTGILSLTGNLTVEYETHPLIKHTSNTTEIIPITLSFNFMLNTYPRVLKIDMCFRGNKLILRSYLSRIEI